MNSQQTRTKEGGSVVTFLVVGVILAAIVVGGIYAVQKRGEVATTGSPTVTSPVIAPSGSAQSTPPNVSPSQSATPPPPSVVPSKSPSTQPSQSPPATVPGTREIPKTGPSDDFLGVMSFAVLLGMAIAYLRSYRYRFGSLRR